jgi:hypothetical protein
LLEERQHHPHDEVMLLMRQFFNAPFAHLIWYGPG